MAVDQRIEFDLDLIRRYDESGPRYTSYPTAVEFHEGFGEAQYRAACARSNQADRPLSLYFHIPCSLTLCWCCGGPPKPVRRYDPV